MFESKYNGLSFRWLLGRNKSMAFGLLIIFYIIPTSEAFSACTWINNHTQGTAASANFADVNACVSEATTGNTVVIPSGNATWSSTLLVNKFITIKGGSGTLTSTGTLIQFSPTSPAENGNFRVTNITANVGRFIYMYLSIENGSSKMTKIRVDNNTVKSTGNVLDVDNGNFYGVVDNNTFTIGSHMDLYGAGCNNWVNNTYSFGTTENLYLENNTVIYASYDLINSLGFGGRVVFRYNNISYSGGGQFFGFDIHGNQGTNHTCGSKGGEYYGNLVDNNGTNDNIKAMDHRDGKVLFFYNLYNTTGSTWVTSRNECNDDQNPIGVTQDASGMPMHLSDTYYFNNRNKNGKHTDYGGTYVSNSSSQDCTQGAYTIAENKDFWGYKESFNGTVGLGCGPLTNRPATCTKGVGYWATNQSCTDLTGMVGANPSNPISGILYKCTATNTWEKYYEPLPYPHPLTMTAGPLNVTIMDTYENGEFWSQYTGKNYTYELTKKLYLNRTIKKVTQNGTELTSKSSIDLCESTSGSYYINAADGTLFVHTTTNADPDSYKIIVYYTMN